MKNLIKCFQILIITAFSAGAAQGVWRVEERPYKLNLKTTSAERGELASNAARSELELDAERTAYTSNTARSELEFNSERDLLRNIQRFHGQIYILAYEDFLKLKKKESSSEDCLKILSAEKQKLYKELCDITYRKKNNENIYLYLKNKEKVTSDLSHRIFDSVSTLNSSDNTQRSNSQISLKDENTENNKQITKKI